MWLAVLLVGTSRNPFNQVTSKKLASIGPSPPAYGRVVIPLIRSQVKNKDTTVLIDEASRVVIPLIRSQVKNTP